MKNEFKGGYQCFKYPSRNICIYIHIHTHVFKKNAWECMTHIFCPLLSPCVILSWRSLQVGINPSALCTAVPPWDTQVVSHPGEHGAGPWAGGVLPSRLVLGRPRCQLLCPRPPAGEAGSVVPRPTAAPRPPGGIDQDFHMNQQVPLEFRVLNTENLGRNILGVDTMPYWIFAL